MRGDKMVKLVAFSMEGTLLKNKNTWNRVMSKLSRNPYYNIIYNFDYLYDNLNNKINVSINNTAFNKLIDESFDYMDLYDGIDDTIKILHQNGIKAAIITAGVKNYADIIAREFKFDYSIANEMKIISGKIRFIKNVDSIRKEIILNKLRIKNGFKRDDIISVGSSLQDISMKNVSGKFIAFNPSAVEVIRVADKIIDGSESLLDILNEPINA
ncbi:hypothetical protein AOG55_04780 [Acidiplasma cupricumulans]|uniref:phosphoserine phosphatase n=4 Tax=Acidiplasma TaxID=507753 RepID=A0A0Q0WKC3_9ARCH|nr:hypothetical protein AOG55_04780 [Acidiplasma cupricumulans]